MQPIIPADHITEYIPQRAPIVMVDNLLFSDELTSLSNLMIKPQMLFVENGRFTEPGLMENIAQTIAARAGYHSKQHQLPVPTGFIGSFKDLEIFELPKVDTEIQTEVQMKHEVLNVSAYEGKVTQNGKLLAKCEIKIVVLQNV